MVNCLTKVFYRHGVTPNDGTTSWLTMSQNSTHVTISGTPGNSQAVNSTFTLYVSDGHCKIF